MLCPCNTSAFQGPHGGRGVLLIAPNGLRKTWNMWSPETEDVAFAQAVLEDVAKRYPIDRDNIFISGYSYGSIMAWRVACDRGGQMNVRALLGISGTLSQGEDCAQTPTHVRHVHGLNDNVLDFEYGADGDATYPAALWRQRMGCGDGHVQSSYNVVDFLTFQRTEWADCAMGTGVVLDTHPGGHFIPHGWIGRQLDELLGRVPTYP